MKKIVVTSALPYANGPIHMGHLVEYIQTDIYVRYLRLRGRDVIYCCADDTHGTAIEINAAKQGIAPQALINEVYADHVAAFQQFDVWFDSFYTTNSPENKEFSDLIFTELHKQGYIYEKSVPLTYCEHCRRFLPDRYVKGECPRCGAPDQYGDNCESCNATYAPTDLKNPFCSICRHQPTQKESSHLFFRLRDFADRILQWMDTASVLQDEVKNYVKGWIAEGLKDWDISRDAPYFGFPIIGYPDKYYYVWLDAPIGYIASTRHYCDIQGKKWEDYWRNPDAHIIHFIGKDIIYFHCLFWPAMLMGAGFSLPKKILVHGFLTVNKEKMSKSRGTFLTAVDYIKRGGDPSWLRFYYAANIGKTLSDIDLNVLEIQNKVNADLVGNFANLVNRVLSFVHRFFKGRVKEKPHSEHETYIQAKIAHIIEQYEEIHLRNVVKGLLELASFGNRYFQEKAPWVTVNSNQEQCHDDVSFLVYLIRDLAILFKPIIPCVVQQIEQQLSVRSLTYDDLHTSLAGHTIGTPAPLVKKIEQFELIQRDPITAVDFRVGHILSAASHPDAEKLVVLHVDIGKEKRQIVAGIRAFYTDVELIGRRIVVITNLKPAKLRGQLSEGMLLAAHDEKILGVATVSKSAAGEKVFFDGFGPCPIAQLSIDDFMKLTIESTADGSIWYNQKRMKTIDEHVIVDRMVAGKVR